MHHTRRGFFGAFASAIVCAKTPAPPVRIAKLSPHELHEQYLRGLSQPLGLAFRKDAFRFAFPSIPREVWEWQSEFNARLNAELDLLAFKPLVIS